MSTLIIVALLVLLTTPEGVPTRCRCITVERRPIGRHIDQVEVNPASSHCSDIEIIATLKRTGLKICLDPEAPWVKKVLEKKLVGLAP